MVSTMNLFSKLFTIVKSGAEGRSHEQWDETFCRTHGLPEVLNAWSACSADDEEEDQEIKDTVDRVDSSRNGGDGDEGEVCAATFHDVNRKTLQGFRPYTGIGILHFN